MTGSTIAVTENLVKTIVVIVLVNYAYKIGVFNLPIQTITNILDALSQPIKRLVISLNGSIDPKESFTIDEALKAIKKDPKALLNIKVKNFKDNVKIKMDETQENDGIELKVPNFNNLFNKIIYSNIRKIFKKKKYFSGQEDQKKEHPLINNLKDISSKLPDTIEENDYLQEIIDEYSDP